MRLTSNKESVARGEVSILAVGETLFAITIVFYLSSHFNTLGWLSVAMCFAPVLLLRTDTSTALGVKWFDIYESWNTRYIDKRLLDSSERLSEIPFGTPISLFTFVCMLIPLVIIRWMLAGIVIRFSATLWSVLSEPIQAFQAIPKNWARITLATDFFHGPEYIPGHPRLGSGLAFFNRFKASAGFVVIYILSPFAIIALLFRNKLLLSLIEHINAESGSSLFDSNDIISQRILRTFEPIIVIAMFLPSLAYRWSLKATSIVYAPLVFVAHSTFHKAINLNAKLDYIRRGDLPRIRVAYGILLVCLFLLKLLLASMWDGFVDWWRGNAISEFVALYVVPNEIPKWQLAEVFNSILAIITMFFARYALLRIDLGQPWPEQPVRRFLGFCAGLRWVLAVYSIVCVGYITIREAQHWHWPTIGTKWVPWQ